MVCEMESTRIIKENILNVSGPDRRRQLDNWTWAISCASEREKMGKVSVKVHGVHNLGRRNFDRNFDRKLLSNNN